MPHRISLSRFTPPTAGLVSFALFLVTWELASASIDSEIDAILARPAVSGNTWSILIETRDGEVLYGRNPTTVRRPASVTKLFTTAAAFDLLGPAHLWNGERIDIASRPINRNSNNTMADDLFRYLGATQGNAYSYNEGRRIVENWASSIGINTGGLVLNDGSGLSWDNRISPVQAIALLRYSLANYSTFQATLTRACHYGTLGSRFCGTEGAGNVYGKTGTLPNGQTVSLTGIFDYDGERYFFSFFANSATDVTATRQAIDDAVMVLANARSTQFAAADWIRTTATTLRLRAGPGTGYEILDSLSQNTIARVHPHPNNGIRANNHSWWFVRVHPDGQEGWLAETFLDAASPPADWPWPDVIVDNSDPGFSASANWVTATWASDKYGPDYHFRSTENVTDWARWSAGLPGSGTYDVYAWWTADTVNRATAAPYIVLHSGGSTHVPADQTTRGGQWNHLGRFEFAHDSSNQVALSCWTSSGTRVIADAVRFVPVDVSLPRFALAVGVEGHGTVERTPDAGDYEQGQPVELFAVPANEFAFIGWNGDLNSHANPLTVTMDGPVSLTAGFARTYEAWTLAYFTEAERENDEISGDLATPSADNIPNLVKYALGLEPRTPVASPLPLPQPQVIPEAGGATYLTLTFSHPSEIEDVEYRVQLSSDLSDWSVPAVLHLKEDKDGVTTRTYRDTDPLDVSGKRFMRLEISR